MSFYRTARPLIPAISRPIKPQTIALKSSKQYSYNITQQYKQSHVLLSWYRQLSTSTSNDTSNNQFSSNNESATDSNNNNATQSSDQSNATDQSSKISELEAKVADLSDQRLRALAECENVRQRSRVDLSSARLYGIQGFAKQLLEVCDTLELMIKNAEAHVDSSNQHFKSLFDGVNMTNNILLKILSNNGMKKMSSMGEKFDPYKHEVLFQVDDESKEPGTIANVMREGYLLHDRTLRASQVGVVKKPANNTNNNTNNQSDNKQ